MIERIRILDTNVYAVLTDRDCGDAREAVDWIFLNQQHSGDVITIDGKAHNKKLSPVTSDANSINRYKYFPVSGDAIVGKHIDKPIGVLGADCGLVSLISREGVVAVIHIGWRGLLTSIIETSAAIMRSMKVKEIFSVLGPCIHSECYEFDYSLAKKISSHINYNVVSETSEGKPALDLPLAITRLLEKENIITLGEIAGCTACNDRWFSHRARKDSMRHGLGVICE